MGFVIGLLVPLFFFLLQLLHLLLMSNTCGARAMLCEAQEEALLRFKDGFSRGDTISSWGVKEEEDCCAWNGIECDNRTGHVVELNLRGHGLFQLKGKISPSLAALKYLRHLDLSENDFEGSSIPPFLGSFERLTYLNLSHANFAGVVPQHLGNLSSLQVLDLSYMYGVESNGEWFSHLHKLQYLDLNSISLKAVNNLLEVLNVLPYLETLHLYDTGINLTQSSHRNVNFTRLSEFGISGDRFLNACWLFNITNLEILDIYFNYLRLDDCRNDFSAKLCNLKKLRLFGGFDTPIKGDLSRFFAECDRRLDLVSLDLSMNSFTGQLPAWPGDYKSLQTLRLGSNKLWGFIPKSIGGMTALKYLDLSLNILTGSLPQSIGGLQYLDYLDLSRNSLTGSIPQSIGGLQSLEYLDLSSNSLTGSIPQSIGGLQSLEHLALSHNNFILDSILHSIDNLQPLHYLDLSSNNLSGPLPMELLRIKSLQSLDLSRNSLRGNLSEEDFVHLGNLSSLDLSSNPLHVTLSSHWVPPFNLTELGLGSCKVGPSFPLWLRTQNRLEFLNMSDSNISDVIPQWLWSFSPYLYDLDLSKNNLSGVVPAAATNSNLRMSSIALYSNKLEGSLSSFPPVKFLLHLSDNYFSGPININDTSKIMILFLSRNNFTGGIPLSFCESPLLRFIDVSYNHLSGPLPSCSGSSCFTSSLHLNNNDLNGTLPTWLADCRDMHFLDIGENNFSGEIPNWISNNMLQLMVLRLRSNSFYGSIPMELSKLTSLQVLDLADNNFSGSIPSTFGNFSAMKIPLSDETCGIKSLHLNNNNLHGAIPTWLWNCTEMVLLDMGENHFYGEIPNWISTSMPNLKVLRLRSNSFYGSIPMELSKLTSLQVLDLAGNNFSGQISPTFGNFNAMKIPLLANETLGFSYGGFYRESIMVAIKGNYWPESESIMKLFTSIDLSGNRLSGNIPVEVGRLVYLKNLNLSHNYLNRCIPETFAKLSQLESLDLSCNDISGEIPQTLSELKSLSSFNVSFNNLSGRIPTGWQFNTFTNSSYMGNSKLCGKPLQTVCPSDLSPPIKGYTVLTDHQKDDDYLLWLSVSVLFGFIMGF